MTKRARIINIVIMTEAAAPKPTISVIWEEPGADPSVKHTARTLEEVPDFLRAAAVNLIEALNRDLDEHLVQRSA